MCKAGEDFAPLADADASAAIFPPRTNKYRHTRKHETQTSDRRPRAWAVRRVENFEHLRDDEPKSTEQAVKLTDAEATLGDSAAGFEDLRGPEQGGTTMLTLRLAE